MSVDSCVVYYGLRYEVSADEIEGLERRTDPRMVSARGARLKTFWSNFGGLEERYVLFVGAELGVLGPEGQVAVQFDSSDVKNMMESTDAHLRSAGLNGEPKLYLEWHGDV